MRATISGAARVFERNLISYRRGWVVLFSGFFEPVFYLFSIGVGVGALVGDVTLVDGTPVSYRAFVAPALLASSAMNGAINEAFNILPRLKYDKLYATMLATPIRPVDVAVGEIVWSVARGGIYAVGFVAVMAALGLVESWLALATIPAALLVGFAFAAAGIAGVSFMRSWQDYELLQLVILPLFLFSATFYPLDVYPPLLQQITRVSPLYHGVELMRGFALGSLDPTMVGHAAVLGVVGAAGTYVAVRRLHRLLLF